MSSHKSISIVFIFFTFFLFASASSLPFVILHGFNDSCSGAAADLQKVLENSSGAKGFCIEIGNGNMDSMLMPIMKQVNIACKKVKEMNELKNGYNLVASSQGNMIGRGLIQLCDDAPPVWNYISLAGPHAGIADFISCQSLKDSELIALCEKAKSWIEKIGMYSPVIQEHFAPSNYIKLLTEMESYLKGSAFLPKINNEVESSRNPTYKKRFSSLNNLVLVLNQDDKLLIPKETSWFGFYKDGSSKLLLPANQTLLYKEDWIGLRSLDEAGKVKKLTCPGGHGAYTSDFINNNIAPYLKSKAL